MRQPKVAIALSERDVLAIRQALIDRDPAAALDVLDEIVQPKLDAALRSGCRPVFEWGGDQTAPPPPIGPQRPDVGKRDA